jgi:hypothetical protein
MNTVNVSSLSGSALDWAIAMCEDLPVVLDPMGFNNGPQAGFWIWDESKRSSAKYQLIGHDYSPTKDWAIGGKLMEKYDIYPSRFHGCATTNPNRYQAGSGIHWMRGETALIAVMRAVVGLRFGKEIELPSHFDIAHKEAVRA